MTIEYQQSVLASLGGGNPDLAAAAAQVNQLTEAYKAGQMSTEEYVELVEDVQRQVNIQGYMAELEGMVHLNTAINGLILIAKAV